MAATSTSEDPFFQLPRSIYYQAVHELDQSLPPAAADTDDARAHRINAAIAQVASMLPASADEVSIAVRCVAAHTQSIDSMRQARQAPDDTARATRCTAQSVAMMRAANSARSLLLRVQAARQKREANSDTCDKAAWSEHCVAGLLFGALKELPLPPPKPAAAAEQRVGALTEAELYAVHHPRRAALIRSLGRLPDNCTFGPPEPELVEAIVASSSPILLALDQQKHLLAA